MARIILSTFGSSGDLNPFIALGLRLREQGHEVRFAVQENFRAAVETPGFPVDLLSGNVVASLAPYTPQMVGKSSPIKSLSILVQHGILPTLAANVEELRQACRDTDLLVTSCAQFSASFVADLTGIRWITIALTPVTIPSAYLITQPQPLTLPEPLQRASNRLSWKLGSVILARIIDQPVNRLRATYHLPPRRELFWLGNASDELVCLACSPAFQPPPPDWPSRVQVTGFCFWDTPADWQPSPELQAFLRADGPLIAVTAGSIGPETRRAFQPYFHTSIAAIRRAGARTLVIGLSAADLDLPLADDVFALPFAPYSAVFPHCATIIHHGGIGTMAQALRFGVPTLVVPWGMDQFYSANQVARLGAGLYLKWRRYTVERATGSIRELLHTAHYAQAARRLRDQMAQEDGVGAICAAIEARLTARPVLSHDKQREQA
jgi:UDP:flavonoid glycosyltransferase YjiC (YdhE family)